MTIDQSTNTRAVARVIQTTLWTKASPILNSHRAPLPHSSSHLAETENPPSPGKPPRQMLSRDVGKENTNYQITKPLWPRYTRAALRQPAATASSSQVLTRVPLEKINPGKIHIVYSVLEAAPWLRHKCFLHRGTRVGLL